MELIRYIHLNPLRAGLVKDLKELDKYPWSGHSTVLGRRKNPLLSEQSKTKKDPSNPVNPVKKEKLLAEKTIEDLLLHFAETKRAATKGYREFVEKGIKQGTREDLQGGGLVRSAGGETAGLLGRKAEEREKGDARILGSGDFVMQALDRANEVFEKGFKARISLDELAKRVTKDKGVDSKELISSKRTEKISNTRAIISYLAGMELNNSGRDIAKYLHLSEKSVSRCIERGKKIIDNDQKLLDYVQ